MMLVRRLRLISHCLLRVLQLMKDRVVCFIAWQLSKLTRLHYVKLMAVPLQHCQYTVVLNFLKLVLKPVAISFVPL